MLDPKQRHKLLMADRTGDATWIAAAIEHLLAADPTVTLLEIETAFRDAACATYLIACPGKTFQVLVGGLLAWRSALAEAGVTPEANRRRRRTDLSLSAGPQRRAKPNHPDLGERLWRAAAAIKAERTPRARHSRQRTTQQPKAKQARRFGS